MRLVSAGPNCHQVLSLTWGFSYIGILHIIHVTLPLHVPPPPNFKYVDLKFDVRC